MFHRSNKDPFGNFTVFQHGDHPMVMFSNLNLPIDFQLICHM